MTLHGRVKNGTVLLQDGDAGVLPDGTMVRVTPVDDLVADTPATTQVSEERKEALRRLIGIWKTEQPPGDEEVERIIEKERMKKYG
jgi:hypothetical protein